jgi:hypothetical protein
MAITERVCPDPPQAHQRGQVCPRGGPKEEGVVHAALEDGHECMSRWNDISGVGLQYEKLWVSRHGLSYDGLLGVAVVF